MQRAQNHCLEFIFEQPERTTLDQLKIKVAALIGHETNLSTEVALYVTLWRSNGLDREELLEQTTFSLRELHVAVLRAFGSLRDNIVTVWGDDKQVVVNGHGCPIGYTCLGSSDVI